ncbi:prevent-host-death protein [Fulvimarina sp. 2208YS6-2-32]|nr:prevent-host-death protein [Fulvimarina sp. 2208YS6-2-32]
MDKAKSELPDLLARAEGGEEIWIARRNLPVVRLDPIPRAATGQRVPGALAHLLKDVPKDLCLEPMSEEDLRDWENGHETDPLK